MWFVDIQQAGQGPTAPQGQAPLPYDAAARMRELYHPTTDAEDRLNQFINQYPQEQKPSILRRIASMIVDYTKGPREGAALFNEPEQKAHQPFCRDLLARSCRQQLRGNYPAALVVGIGKDYICQYRTNNK